MQAHTEASAPLQTTTEYLGVFGRTTQRVCVRVSRVVHVPPPPLCNSYAKVRN